MIVNGNDNVMEILRNSDPVKAGYHSANLEAMISRVMAVTALAPVTAAKRVQRGFVAKMIGSVATAAALVTWGIAALTGLVVAPVVLTVAASGGFSSAAVAAPINYQFNTDNLGTKKSAEPIYTLELASSPTKSLSQIAQTLGLTTGVVTHSGDTWSGSGNGMLVTLTTSAGIANWNVTNSGGRGLRGLGASTGVVNPPLTPSSSTPSKSPSDTTQTTLADNMAVAVAKATGWAQQLGYSLGTPLVNAEGLNASSLIDVTLPIVVGGLPTNLSLYFQVTGTGTLVSASGTMFTATTGAAYPGVSAKKAAEFITSEQGLVNQMNGGGCNVCEVNGIMDSAPVTPLPTGVGTKTLPDAVLAMLPTMKVDLTHATLEYGLFTLTNETSVLVPIWVYQGVSGVKEYSYDVYFSALAIEQSYVQLAPSMAGPANY